MTQVLAVLTHDFVVMASDRRLTYLNGQIKTDNECKLVSLCNHSCIGYTGVATIDFSPTHEWIAKTLARHGCRDGVLVTEILADEASKTFKLLKNYNKQNKHTTFLVVGWQETNYGLLPYLARISNAYNEDESYREYANDEFKVNGVILAKDVPFYQADVGVVLQREQRRRLSRYLKKISSKEGLAGATLRVLTDEIINSSGLHIAVGNKILGVSIPKGSVERQKTTGASVMLATQPNASVASFTYFKQGDRELVQYGPTFVCGKNAFSNTVTTRSDKKLSVSFKMLTSSK